MKAFTPLILLVLVAVAYFMYMKPAYDQIQILSASKARYDDVLVKAKDLVAKRDQILSDYNAIPPSDIDRLKKIIPEKSDSITIARHVNAISAKYGIVIKSIKVSEQASSGMVMESSAQAPNVKNLSASFGFKGTYTQFVNFIKDLESGLMLIDVNKLSVAVGTGELKGQSTLSYDFNVNFLTYSFN